jgi:hypothetical protein
MKKKMTYREELERTEKKKEAINQKYRKRVQKLAKKLSLRKIADHLGMSLGQAHKFLHERLS